MFASALTVKTSGSPFEAAPNVLVLLACQVLVSEHQHARRAKCAVQLRKSLIADRFGQVDPANLNTEVGVILSIYMAESLLQVLAVNNSPTQMGALCL